MYDLNENVFIGDAEISNKNKITLIAGPCQIEDEDSAIAIAQALKRISVQKNINIIYKASFDKANRTSLDGPRGIGIEDAYEVFSHIRHVIGLRATTDFHTPRQIEYLSPQIDLIQIPALLSRQTDLLVAAGQSAIPVNIKKGQFSSPKDIVFAIEKVAAQGNRNVMVTDRGTCFGYNDIIADMRSLEIMKNRIDVKVPVIFDATHTVQSPGGGNSSGGDWTMTPVLARAATAVGIAGIFIETHFNPREGLSDSAIMTKVDDLDDIITSLLKIDQSVKGWENHER